MFRYIFLTVSLFGFLDLVFGASPHQRATLSARLIHRSSPESPFYDPSYTRNKHVKNAVRGSLSRSRYFSQNKVASAGNYIAAPVDDWSFVMRYAIGTPPVDRYGILDTGSTLTWFQCLPCNRCYGQGKLPLFDPTTSSSYKSVICETPQCDMVPSHICQDLRFSPYCYYSITYGDSSTSAGILSMETLTLSTRSIKKMIFGCATDNRLHSDLSTPGVVGVGNHSSSLLGQLSFSHFSYFQFANGTNIGGEVHFGPGASLSGSVANTPFVPSDNGFYYLNLTGISVNGADLDLPPGIFDKSVRDEYRTGFIIDSGTTYTILTHQALDKLKDAIKDEMYMYDSPVKVDYFEMCYKDYVGGAPEVTFMFQGLDYVLCDSNLWVKRRGRYHCLAILPSSSKFDKMSVLGIHQQRNVQVGYDLEKNLLTLNYPEACPGDAIDFLQ